jgi:hypothetical protein
MKKTKEVNFENVALPLVRNVFASLISSDIVSVQALSGPTGQLYYMDDKKSLEQLMKELAEIQQKQEQEAYENNLKEYLEEVWH